MPTGIRAERRVDGASTKGEVVRVGNSLSTRRPIVSIEVSAPESTSIASRRIYGPAAHEE